MFTLVAATTAVVFSTSAATRGASPNRSEPRSVKLPFTLDHNRMIVEVEFFRRDGTVRKARAWVDSGNPVLMLGEKLARDLGLEVAPSEPSATQNRKLWATRTPQLLLKGMALDVTGIRTQVLAGAQSLPGVPGEANLPASVLRHDHVVFDYPKRELTVARPGVLKPRGEAIPGRVQGETGLFQIEALTEDGALQLAVDNGSSYTWLSNTLTTSWETLHPDWPHATGAVGAANFFGFEFESGGELVRLPELHLGRLTASGVGVLGLPQPFFDWYSKKTAAPVNGFIGANVLKGFRVEVDYPNGMTYWEAGPPPAFFDLDVVGVTLRPEGDGGFTIAGVASRDGAAAVEGVRAGDKLLRIGTLEVARQTMGSVSDALAGKPGAVRALTVERDGKRIVVNAMVSRFP